MEGYISNFVGGETIQVSLCDLQEDLEKIGFDGIKNKHSIKIELKLFIQDTSILNKKYSFLEPFLKDGETKVLIHL